MTKTYLLALVLLTNGCGSDRRLGGEPTQDAGKAGTSGAASTQGGASRVATSIERSELGGATASPSSATGGTVLTMGSAGGAASSLINTVATSAVTPKGGTAGMSSIATAVSKGGTSAISLASTSTVRGGSPSAAGGAGSGGSPLRAGNAGSFASAGRASATMGGASSTIAGAAGMAMASAGTAGRPAGCVDGCSLYGSTCCAWPDSCMPVGTHCTIDFFSTRIRSQVKDYADLERQFVEGSKEALFSITDADVVYAEIDAAPSARMLWHLTEEASLKYRQSLIQLNELRPFQVSCNGVALYLGVTYIWYGEYANPCPILDWGTDEENLLTLAISASGSSWYGSGWNINPDPAYSERFDRPEVRAAFCQRGAMREMNPDARPPDGRY